MISKPIDSPTQVVSPASGVERLRARLWDAAQDLAANRITASEANRITKETGRELREVEAAMRAARAAMRAAKLGGG